MLQDCKTGSNQSVQTDYMILRCAGINIPYKYMVLNVNLVHFAKGQSLKGAWPPIISYLPLKITVITDLITVIKLGQ